MVIYEVNLMINKDIYEQYYVWLEEHAKEMLKFPGFMSARILKQEIDSNCEQEKLTVYYELKDRESLELYFTEFAEKMRGDGVNRFKGQFSAERRIFEELVYLK